MSNLSIGLLIGASVSNHFTNTTSFVNRQLRMIGDEASKLSRQKTKLNMLGDAESGLEKARAKAYAATQAVMALQKELKNGPPRKDWAKDFEAAKAASEKAAQGVQKARTQVEKADAAFRQAGGAAGGYAANMQRVGTELERVQAKQAKLNKYLQAKGDLGEWGASARSAALGTGVAIGGAVVGIIKPAMEFETAMLGVAKQVEGARDAGGNLTPVYHDMSKQIQMLGRELPIATNEIASMVTAGARMGVAKNELIGFTRTAAMMSEAFELPAGPLADQMGKIAGLYKIPIPAIGSLADSINYLDDNAISKGGDIIDFLSRTGGVAGSVKVTGQEMAALGSTLLTLGERTETAGTAVNAIFQKLGAADKGTKKFKAALSEVGLSTAQVQKGMQKDAIGTLMKVMEAVGKLPAEKQLGVMVELVGLEHSDTLAKLANNTGEFRRQLGLARSDAAKGSMEKEFQARMQTTQAQWSVLKNTLGELAVNIGSVVLPPLVSLTKTLGAALAPIADFARENPAVVKSLLGMAGGFLLNKAVIGPVIGLIGNLGKVWTVLSLAFSLNPIGLAVRALVVGAGLIAANWGTIGPWLSGVFDSIGNGLDRLGTWASESFISMARSIGNFITSAGSILSAGASMLLGGLQAVFSWTPLGLIVNNWSAIITFFQSLPAKFVAIGSAIIDGISNGLTAKFEALKATVTGLGDSVAGWFKEKLGIRSPSRVFMGFGEMVGEGARLGIASMVGAVALAGGQLANAAQADWSATTPAISVVKAASAVSNLAGSESQPIAARPMSLSSGEFALAPTQGATNNAAASSAPITVNVGPFHITQLAGEDSAALARRVAEMVKRETEGAKRAALGDWA